MSRVLVVVVRPELALCSIRREFSLLVHHDEPGSFPWLARFAHPAPDLVVDFVHAAADEVVSGRFTANALIGRGARSGAGIDRFASSQDGEGEDDE